MLFVLDALVQLRHQQYCTTSSRRHSDRTGRQKQEEEGFQIFTQMWYDIIKNSKKNRTTRYNNFIRRFAGFSVRPPIIRSSSVGKKFTSRVCCWSILFAPLWCHHASDHEGRRVDNRARGKREVARPCRAHVGICWDRERNQNRLLRLVPSSRRRLCAGLRATKGRLA